MSCQKGNANRTRPQKYQNHTAFKNDLHDKSSKTKHINNLEIANVCERCKKIIQWKIKYKKYKPLKAPSKCTKCEQKTVKHTYHIMCLLCAKEQAVCPKCGEKAPIIESKPSQEENIKMDAELQLLLKRLPERKRRTFIRYMNRKGTSKKFDSENDENSEQDLDTNINNDDKDSHPEKFISKEELLLKLKSLVINREGDDCFDSNSNSNEDAGNSSDCSDEL